MWYGMVSHNLYYVTFHLRLSDVQTFKFHTGIALSSSTVCTQSTKNKNKSWARPGPRNKKAAYITDSKQKTAVHGADDTFLLLWWETARGPGWVRTETSIAGLMTGPVTHPLARSRLVKILQVHLGFVGFQSRTTLTSTFSRCLIKLAVQGALVVPPDGKDDKIAAREMSGWSLFLHFCH